MDVPGKDVSPAETRANVWSSCRCPSNTNFFLETMPKPTIAKRPVGRPPKAQAAVAPRRNGCPFHDCTDPEASLKWVMDCPHRVVVLKAEWFQPGCTISWRDTYVTSYQHALSAFGADLHAEKVKLTALSVSRNSPPHQMAVNNHNAFVNKVMSLRAAKREAQAANALATLPGGASSDSSGDT